MLYCCGHGISSFPCISILAFVPSFSSIFATIDTCHVSHWNLEALQPGRVTVPQRQVEGNCVRERVREMSRFTGNALNKHSVVFLVAPATKQNPPCIRKCLGQIAVSVSG